ncbi:MAG: RNase adapter RapZ [Eubacteriales bacterium]
MNFVFITGVSGAGKSNAANTLEDMGYYCIDNMPVMLISKFVDIYTQLPEKNTKVAFVIYVRGETEFKAFEEELSNLKSSGYNCMTVFLDCTDNVLIARYKETRRIHPLTASLGYTVLDAIKKERELLGNAKNAADFIIDTSHLTTHQLKEKISAVLLSGARHGPVINCMSFGFKYGVPAESDLQFDVRCFPNPFYIPELKEKTGLDADVRDYVFSFPQTQSFMDKLYDMLDFLMPYYVEEGKLQIIISIGCTGGKHRSVAIAQALYEHFNAKGMNAVLQHRDIDKR